MMAAETETADAAADIWTYVRQRTGKAEIISLHIIATGTKQSHDNVKTTLFRNLTLSSFMPQNLFCLQKYTYDVLFFYYTYVFQVL